MNYIYYTIILVLLFLCILLIPIQIHFFYTFKNNQAKLKVRVKVLYITINSIISKPVVKIFSFLARRRYTPDNLKEVIEKEEMPKKNWGLILTRIYIWIPRLIKILSQTLKLTRKIFKPVRCKKLNITSEIGLANPSQTGIAYGGIWVLISSLISEFSKWVVLKPTTPKIEIKPDFNNSKLQLEYDCIIVFPLGHIIIVIVEIVRFIRVNYVLINGMKSLSNVEKS